MNGPPCRVSGEDDICWVCLEGPSHTSGKLEYPCSCPRGVHAKCLARWQLQSAGREEERFCRFCKAELPDWRNTLTPKVPAAPPVMAIVYDGKVVRLQVKPGKEGMDEFQRQVRQAFNLGDDVELDCVFDCRAPGTGEKIKLRGLESYAAAMHCAAVAAGERLAKMATSTGPPLPPRSGGIGSSNGGSGGGSSSNSTTIATATTATGITSNNVNNLNNSHIETSLAAPASAEDVCSATTPFLNSSLSATSTSSTSAAPVAAVTPRASAQAPAASSGGLCPHCPNSQSLSSHLSNISTSPVSCHVPSHMPNHMQPHILPSQYGSRGDVGRSFSSGSGTSSGSGSGRQLSGGSCGRKKNLFSQFLKSLSSARRIS